MNTKIICPACGSDNVERSENMVIGKLTLGPEFKFKEVACKCHDCETEGDFLNETEPYYLKAEKEAQNILIKQLIDGLKESDISMVFFERVFELPFRTLTRWKSGDFSAAALALLRVIKTYPWISEVAQEGFSPIFSRKILVSEALSYLEEEKNTEKKSLEKLVSFVLQGSNNGVNFLYITNCSSPVTPKITEGSVYQAVGG
jgi:hypothetical protein